MTDRADADYLRTLPKVELHCHLEGSVPAVTAIELARQNEVSLPTLDPDELYSFTTLESFLEIYQAVSKTIVTAGDFATVTYESLAEAAVSSNLRYREIAFNPTNHPGISVADALKGVTDGITSAQRDHGVTARIIVAINREQGAEVATDLVRAVVDAANPLVVGVGLDHNELAGPPALFAGAYDIAAAAGLHRTAHAGERGDTAEVADSIDLLGLDRVDHGYAVLGDPALVRRSIEEHIHYATCWSTSIVHAGGGAALSPIGPMIAAGLDVSVSSDDPPFFPTDIGTEFVLAGAQLGWTAAAAQHRVLAAAHASFLPKDEKADLIASLGF